MAPTLTACSRACPRASPRAGPCALPSPAPAFFVGGRTLFGNGPRGGRRSTGSRWSGPISSKKTPARAKHAFILVMFIASINDFSSCFAFFRNESVPFAATIRSSLRPALFAGALAGTLYLGIRGAALGGVRLAIGDRTRPRRVIPNARP